MTRQTFENAIRVNAAIDGSTNAVIHLLAIAGRLGVPLRLDDFDELARPVPTLATGRSAPADEEVRVRRVRHLD
jgi:dihydroxy-acid dehydratase